MSTLVGDTLYFSASDGTTGNELWAHDTSNHSTWQAANINFGSLGNSMTLLIEDNISLPLAEAVSLGRIAHPSSQPMMEARAIN